MPTHDDFNRWRFNHDVVHFNGGREFFGYGHRCVDEPRLLVIDKYFNRDRSTKRSYLVDDQTQCATLDDALAALSVPATLTEEEQGLLDALPAGEWVRLEKRAPYMPLVAKGFAEWGRNDQGEVVCRRKP